METEINLLRRMEGLKLEVLEANCCGLAGAFGYDKQHYDTSRALAERAKFCRPFATAGRKP